MRISIVFAIFLCLITTNVNAGRVQPEYDSGLINFLELPLWVWVSVVFGFIVFLIVGGVILRIKK